MKTISLKTKIALWMFALVMVIALISSFTVIYFSNNVTQNSMKRNLILAVEANIDEIQICTDRQQLSLDDEFDILVEDGGLFIEIDDGFSKTLNDVTTTLYNADSVLYGEGIVNPLAVPFSETGIRSIKSNGSRYYIYDKRVHSAESDSIWLRGVVSQSLGFSQTVNVVDSYLYIIPLMALISVAGAFFLARRSLRPMESIALSADEIQHGNDLTKRLSVEGKSRETQKLIDSFNSMLERLELSFERERRFNSDISHELRTPVSVILSASELALEDAKDEDTVDSLERINRQAKKMQKMINEMLELSRLGNESIKLEPTDFSAVVKSVCEEFSVISTKGIILQNEIEDNIIIEADALLISRLCENLIANAFSYGKENGRVDVSLKREGDYACLSVKDDGIGISEEDKEKIFDTFFRADSSRSKKGFGLGLNFVKTISQLHGGEITVNSIINLGSEFIYRQKIIEKNNEL